MLEILSFGSIFGVFVGSPTRFALSYSLGNILSLLGFRFQNCLSNCFFEFQALAFFLGSNINSNR